MHGKRRLPFAPGCKEVRLSSLAGTVAAAGLISVALPLAPFAVSTAQATCAFSYGDVPDPEPGPSFVTIAKALRARWPQLADVMSRGDTAMSRVSDLHVVADAVARANSGSVDRIQADLVIFAASFWSMDYSTDDSIRVREFNTLMGPYGGRFEEIHDGYCYDDGLLDALLDRAGGMNPWADDAFLWRMHQGFDDPCRECFGPRDLYIEVIRRGERFLALHPRSRIVPDVERMIGEAHETAWSLSLFDRTSESQDSNFFVADQARYVPDAPAHRQTAIRQNERYLSTRSHEPWSPDVRRRLDLLRANRDTGFYKYYCCCWD